MSDSTLLSRGEKSSLKHDIHMDDLFIFIFLDTHEMTLKHTHTHSHPSPSLYLGSWVFFCFARATTAYPNLLPYALKVARELLRFEKRKAAAASVSMMRMMTSQRCDLRADADRFDFDTDVLVFCLT